MKKLLLSILLLQSFIAFPDHIKELLSVTESFETAIADNIDTIFGQTRDSVQKKMEHLEKSFDENVLAIAGSLLCGLLVSARYIVKERKLTISDANLIEMDQLTNRFKTILRVPCVMDPENTNISEEQIESETNFVVDYLYDRALHIYRENCIYE